MSNIYVKDVSSRLDSEQLHLRLAVRLPKENKEFIQCLNKITMEQ